MGLRDRALAVLAFAVLAMPAPAAWSQARQPQPAPAATPAAAQPERTTATYGDWTLRCESQAAGAATKACEAAHAVLDGRGRAVAQFVIGRPAGSQATGMVAVVQVPVNATVAEPARFMLEASAPPVLSLPFRSCTSRGCFAEAPLPEQELSRLRQRAEPVRLEYRDAARSPVALSISLRGLGAALDALERETR